MSNRERAQLLWMLLLVVVSLLAAALCLVACSRAQAPAASMTVDQGVQAVTSAIDNTASSVVNEAWPVVSISIGLATVYVLGNLWQTAIRWRQLKNGGHKRP